MIDVSVRGIDVFVTILADILYNTKNDFMYIILCCDPLCENYLQILAIWSKPIIYKASTSWIPKLVGQLCEMAKQRQVFDYVHANEVIKNWIAYGSLIWSL